MKKSLIVATAFASIFLSSIVYAFDIDLKSMSDTEITQLYSDVEQELVERNINKSSELLPGKYVGGVDIPVGGYDVYSPSGDDSFDIMLTGLNKTDLDYYYREQVSSDEEANFHISVKEGYTLTVSGRSGTITINNGLNFE